MLPVPCPPVQECVLSPLGCKFHPFWLEASDPDSSSIHLLGSADHYARKRGRAGGGWETSSISHLDHPSMGAWLPFTHPDERRNSHSEGRRDLLSCFKCFAGCVYWPINYLSVSFNSLGPGKKLQTMIPMWLFRVMEITKLSSLGKHQAV